MNSLRSIQKHVFEIQENSVLTKYFENFLLPRYHPERCFKKDSFSLRSDIKFFLLIDALMEKIELIFSEKHEFEYSVE